VKLSRAAIALYMSLVFASGAALGVFGHRYYQSVTTVASKGKGKNRRPSPEEFRRGTVTYMQKRLNLTDEQVAKLNTIMDDARAALDDIIRRTVPEQAAVGTQQVEKIRAMLTADQRPEYEKMLKEREERQKNKGKGKGKRNKTPAPN
jgi:Spy/CpxP family protein refolding chaperone